MKTFILVIELILASCAGLAIGWVMYLVAG